MHAKKGSERLLAQSMGFIAEECAELIATWQKGDAPSKPSPEIERRQSARGPKRTKLL